MYVNMKKQNVKEPCEAYASLVDLESTTPLLMAIFGSHEYLAAGCGGDVALAGAIEARLSTWRVGWHCRH